MYGGAEGKTREGLRKGTGELRRKLRVMGQRGKGWESGKTEGRAGRKEDLKTPGIGRIEKTKREDRTGGVRGPGTPEGGGAQRLSGSRSRGVKGAKNGGSEEEASVF